MADNLHPHHYAVRHSHRVGVGFELQGIPSSLESYYQQAGRAGRDGLPAECCLLWSAQDFVVSLQVCGLGPCPNYCAVLCCSVVHNKACQPLRMPAAT